MKAENVYGRRYFYPLITAFEQYRDYPTAAASNLPIATKIAEQVICLPMHHELTDADVRRIISVIDNR